MERLSTQEADKEWITKMTIALKNGCKLRHVEKTLYVYGITDVMVRFIDERSLDDSAFTDEAKESIKEGIERLKRESPTGPPKLRKE